MSQDFLVKQGLIRVITVEPAENSEAFTSNSVNEELNSTECQSFDDGGNTEAPVTDNNPIPQTEKSLEPSVDKGKSLKSGERWSDEEISFLLTSMADYYPNIGKFRSGFDGMGDIWAKISSDFQERFDVRRTSEQCKSK